MSHFIAATKARKEFFKLIEASSIQGNPTAITIDGVPKVMMMSYDEFEGWMETMEIMSNPELMKDIQEGMKDIEEGRTISLEEFENELRKTNKVSPRTQQKKPKKPQRN